MAIIGIIGIEGQARTGGVMKKVEQMGERGQLDGCGKIAGEEIGRIPEVEADMAPFEGVSEEGGDVGEEVGLRGWFAGTEVTLANVVGEESGEGSLEVRKAGKAGDGEWIHEGYGTSSERRR